MDEKEGCTEKQRQTEYELLFCLRDLLRIYMEQQMSIYGRCSGSFKTTLDDIETRIDELGDSL